MALNREGRKAGSLNKFNASIKDMILGALSDVGGRDYLAEQARKNPVAFMGLVGKVLPLQIAGADGGALIVNFRWADEPEPTPTIEATAVDTDKAVDADVDTPRITFDDC